MKRELAHRRRGATAAIAGALAVAVLVAAGGGVEQEAAQAQAVPPAAKAMRVYVVVLDGLIPDEVGALTPNLDALKSGGTWYDQARGVFPAETVPNHVAMMTGVLPSRSGIVGNDFWAPNDSSSKSRMAHPRLLGVDTITTRLETRCDTNVSTATVQSKGYLWGIFRGEPPADAATPPGLSDAIARENVDHPGSQRQADHHWKPIGRPGYIPDPDDHAIDQATMTDEPGGFMTWLATEPPAPHFAFVNLGDIDRSGHVDMSGVSYAFGGDASAFRQFALANTDRLVGDLVDQLKSSGAWEETVLIFTSDHGMDWSPPDNGTGFVAPVRSIDVTDVLVNRNGYTTDLSGRPGRQTSTSEGDFNVVPGGGTAAVYLEEDNQIPDVARILAQHPAVELVATPDPVSGLANNPTLGEMGMHHRHNGDIVITVRPGWAVRDSSSGNPIPGNHGHSVTQRSVLMVTGGHPALKDGARPVLGPEVYAPDDDVLFSRPEAGPGNLSIAPTVAALFGLGEPPGGYDGKPLSDAFEPWAFAPHRPCEAPSPPPPPVDDGPGGTQDPPSGGTTAPGGTAPTTSPTTSNPRPADDADAATAAPRISRLRVRPRSFAPRMRRPRIARLRRGAAVRYFNTQPARTRFAVARRVSRSGEGRRYRRVRGSFAHIDVRGRNSFRMTGWVRGRRLKAGTYRLKAVARNTFGRSRAVRTTFRIERR